MEQAQQGKDALISGIQTDAQTEEERIAAEAAQQAEEKRRYAQQKAQSILDEAKQKADQQALVIRRKILSDCDIAVKRQALHLRDTVMHDITRRVEQKFDALRSDPAYRAMLTEWIIEAAIGLQADAAVVNASQGEKDMIDAAMLSEAADTVQKLTGKTVTLSVSDQEPLSGQGPTLTSCDGRVAFNNQVQTRLRRKQRDIQKLIYDALFVESDEAGDEKAEM